MTSTASEHFVFAEPSRNIKKFRKVINTWHTQLPNIDYSLLYFKLPHFEKPIMKNPYY